MAILSSACFFMDFISVYNWCSRLVDVAQMPTCKIFDIPECHPTLRGMCMLHRSSLPIKLLPTIIFKRSTYSSFLTRFWYILMGSSGEFPSKRYSIKKGGDGGGDRKNFRTPPTCVTFADPPLPISG